ncbi:MAG: YlbF family regulator [Clostridia bacterium]|nr:YlbF family regulator [Clostridia bacterium]
MADNAKTPNVFELAMKLGLALKDDPRLVRMQKAREAFENDADMSTLMTEYEVQQKALENVATGGTFDPEMVQMIQDRIDVLYKQINENPMCQELTAAQEEVNELMNAVNNTITFAITGQMPTSCGGNCSSCGGGCH